MYVSANPDGRRVGYPGDSESVTPADRGRFTGVVRVFESMDELKGFKYEPLTTLTETNRTGARSREEMIISLQKRAGELGANAIAIVDEQGTTKDVDRIRVNAVRILESKNHF
jgi:hypothetical protein